MLYVEMNEPEMDAQANGGRHGEERMFVAVLSLNPKKLGREVRNV